MKYTTVTLYQLSPTLGRPYFAYHPDFAGCMAQGGTPCEARERLDAVRADVIEYLRENDLPIPAPKRLVNNDVFRIEI